MNIEKFKSLKTVKRVITSHGEIRRDNEPIIDEFLALHHGNMQLRKVLLNMYSHIAIVGVYAHPHEVWNALTNKLHSHGNNGGSLVHFIHIYGETCGKIMYDKFSGNISTRNKIKSSKSHRVTLFDSEEDYDVWAKGVAEKTQKTKRINGKFGKQYSVLCKEYYYRLGITDEDVITQRIHDAKMKSWVYSYSDEQKQDIISKVMKTKHENYRNGIYPSSAAGHSQKANTFFKKVLDLLPEEIINRIVTINTTGKEYWVRDKDTPLKYYYIDFCIPSLLAVEYNGNAYHPKHESDEVYIAHKMGGLPVCEKYEYDIQKSKSIEFAGFKLLTVWDDNEDVDTTAKWIKEVYYGQF